MPLAATGALCVVVVPSPSWPLSLPPQQYTVPAARSAQVWSAPAARAVAPTVPPSATPRPWTWTGVLLRAGAGLAAPSGDGVLSPQHTAVPSASAAQVWWAPAAMAIAGVEAPPMPLTATGTELGS